MVPHQFGHKAVDGASGSSEALEKHPRNSVAYGIRKLGLSGSLKPTFLKTTAEFFGAEESSEIS
jgi:hypothetical protein